MPLLHARLFRLTHCRLSPNLRPRLTPVKSCGMNTPPAKWPRGSGGGGGGSGGGAGSGAGRSGDGLRGEAVFGLISSRPVQRADMAYSCNPYG